MRPPKVKPFEADSMPHYHWIVWYHDESGKRARRLFKTKASANSFADDMAVKAANLGHEHAALLTNAVMRDAAEAWKLIEPLGLSLVDVAKEYTARAVYRHKNITMSEVVDAFLESQRLRGSSKAHRQVLKSRLGKFAAEFGEQNACDLHKMDIVAWVNRTFPASETANNAVKEIRSCFEWAKGQSYIAENPLSVTKDVKRKVIRPEPGILSVEEFSQLLAACHPDVLPYFAIAGFAGIRPDELLRLEWRKVRLDEKLIEVKDSEAKVNGRRFAKIEPALEAFLSPYKNCSGKVCPPSWRRHFRAARRFVGFGKPGTETPEEKACAIRLKPWVSDTLRHSFASYHLAHFNDAAATALQMGHRGTATLFAHYRALVTPTDGAAWWALRPENIDSKVV